MKQVKFARSLKIASNLVCTFQPTPSPTQKPDKPNEKLPKRVKQRTTIVWAVFSAPELFWNQILQGKCNEMARFNKKHFKISFQMINDKWKMSKTQSLHGQVRENKDAFDKSSR